FASDLKRTKETAEIISAAIGAPVHFDPRIRETNVGSMSGKPLDDFQKLFPRKEDRFTKSNEEGAESLADVRTRAWDFLRDTEAKHAGKNILIVSHEDTVWMLCQAANGWSDRE